MKKIKNRIISVALSVVTTATALLSALPMPANAVNNVPGCPEFIDQTTYNILNLFGNLNKKDYSTYENDPTVQQKLGNTNYTHINSPNAINISNNDLNYYQQYCNDIADGYNFTMSHNFDCTNQVLYRNGLEYDPTNTTLGIDINDNTTPYEGFFNYNASRVKITDPDIVANFKNYTDNSNYGISKQGNAIYMNMNNEISIGNEGGNYEGYTVLLNDNDKNNLAYKYNRVGTYTDEHKQRHIIDVKITVDDFDYADHFSTAGMVYLNTTLYTQEEYNKLNSAQKSCLIKIPNILKNGQVYSYRLPNTNITKSRLCGLTGNTAFPPRIYYAPKLVFRNDKVGIGTYMISWIKLRYEFFESGTYNPIDVKGVTCWKDVDYSQGVSFKQSDIDNGTIESFGPWTNNISNIRNAKHFFKNQFKAGKDNYIGYFESNQYDTSDDDEYAWLYAKFKGNNFTTLYSFSGIGRDTCNDTNEESRHALVTPSGTIANDLPEINLTQNLQIIKNVNRNGTSPATASKSLYPDLNEALRFYIQDSNGYFIQFKKTSDGDWEYAQATEFDNTLDAFDAPSFLSEKDNYLLPLDEEGQQYVSSLPIDTYTIYECLDPDYVKQHPEILGKYTMLNRVINLSRKKINNSENINWTNYAPSTYTITFLNGIQPARVNIQKTITQVDGKTVNANSSNAKKLLDNVQFAIRRSDNKYAKISEDGNVSWSEKISYFYMPNGSLKNINLPYDRYTLIEEAIDNKVNTIWDTDKSVDFIVNGANGTVEDDGSLTCNIAIDNPELYGGISIQKTTETNEDISDIEFILSGTSDSGRKINMLMTTDKNGKAKLDKVPVGTYTLSENPDTVNTEKWQVAKDREVTIKVGQKAEANKETVENKGKEPEKGNISINKIDAESKEVLSGAEFTIYTDVNGNGTYDDSDKVSDIKTSNSEGLAIFIKLDAGKYLVKETKAPEGYMLDNNFYPVTVVANQTVEVKNSNDGFANKPIKGNIKLTKVDEDDHKKLLSNAHFVVYKDTNENGYYDEADVAIGNMTEVSKGNYSIDGLRYGKYVIREIKAPDGYIADTKSYPIDITECKTYVISNIQNASLFGNKAKPVSITLTKRIPVDELNGDVWFPHGNPTFILRLKNTTQGEEYGRTYYKAMEFTKDYMKEHTIEIAGKKYVEMSVTYDNLKAGTYTADETVAGQRYKLKDILNISDNATIKNDKCEFSLVPGQEGKATFFNVKKFWDTNTHNCLCVNVIKK